jgi:hypothetical protein
MLNGSHLIVDEEGNCIIDGQVIKLDEVKNYDEENSFVLVFDDSNIIVAQGLPWKHINKSKRRIKINDLRTKIETLLLGKLPDTLTLETQGLALYHILLKKIEATRLPGGGMTAPAAGARGGGEEVPLMAAQEQINKFHDSINKHIKTKIPNQADVKLAADVERLKANLSQPSFLQRMGEEFKKPLVNMSTRVVGLIKTRLRFQETHANAVAFDQDLTKCIIKMMSAKEFYTKLAFTAYYKRSFFRLFAGVGCTYLEAELALTVAFSIINNALFTASVGYVPNMGTIIGALNNAYQSCTQKNVILLLTSMGVSLENASQIYEKMKDLTMEQMKFVLKFLFMKKVVGGIESAEQGNPGGNAAPPQHPTFMELMSNPGLFIDYLRSIGPPGVHGVAGAPESSLQGRAITSFREFMTGVIETKLMNQLNTVFPDTANDQIDAIIFELLLNLPENASTQNTEIAFALFRHQLYTCLEEMAYNRSGFSQDDFRTMCGEVCPGLLENCGLNEATLTEVYGGSDKMSEENSQLPRWSDTPLDQRFASLEESKSYFMGVLELLKKNSSEFCEQTKHWFGSLFDVESGRLPGSIHEQPLNRPHAVFELAKTCDNIKKEMAAKLSPENLERFNHSIERVNEAFRRTITFSGPRKMSTTGQTEYDYSIEQFNKTMLMLKSLAPSKVIRDFINDLISLASDEYEHYCELLSVRCLPFAGNSQGAYLAEGVIEQISEQLERLIEASAQALDAINSESDDSSTGPAQSSNLSSLFNSPSAGSSERSSPGGNLGSFAPGGNLGSFAQGGNLGSFAQGGNLGSFAQGGNLGRGGGRSRSRKHSVSKRTRRKGIAKKQNSKKNKRQSRRKVRRASSRKLRK